MLLVQAQKKETCKVNLFCWVCVVGVLMLGVWCLAAWMDCLREFWQNF